MARTISAPTAIANCIAWLDAGQGISLDGSGKVSQWADLSGTANHFSQSTGAARPSMGTVNGRTVVAFDGVDDVLVAASNITENAISIFVVCRLRTAQTNYRAVLTTRNSALYGSLSAGGWGSYSGGDRPSGEAMSTTLGTYAVVRADETLGNIRLRSNGVTVARHGSNVLSNRSTTELNNAGGSNLDIAELIVYSRAVTDGEAVLVEQYLARKWGVEPQRLIASPLVVPDCALWVDAAQGITLDGSNLVSQWSDLSGNGRHMTQAAGGKRPSVTASALNGLPAVTFDGVDDFLQALFTLSQPVVGIHVIRVNTFGTAGSHELFADGGNSGSMYLAAQSPGAPPQTYIYSGFSLLTAQVFSGFQVYTGNHNGLYSSLRVKGLTLANGNVGAATPGGFTLGANGAGSASRSAAISVAESLLFSRRISDGEQFLIETYLRRKFAL